MLRLLAFLSAFIGFPLFANAWDIKINDNNSSVIYSTVGDEGTGPTWNIEDTSNSTPKDYMNDGHYSNFSTIPSFYIYGSDAVVNFTGTGITWIGKIGSNFGIAAYSVDGGKPVIFDAYNNGSFPKTTMSLSPVWYPGRIV